MNINIGCGATPWMDGSGTQDAAELTQVNIGVALTQHAQHGGWNSDSGQREPHPLAVRISLSNYPYTQEDGVGSGGDFAGPSRQGI
jgi:hypothetical protein